jgi:hypothetical protein
MLTRYYILMMGFVNHVHPSFLSLREDSGIVEEVRRQVLAMADHHQMTFVAISEAVEEIMEVEEEVSGYWMFLSIAFIRFFESMFLKRSSLSL